MQCPLKGCLQGRENWCGALSELREELAAADEVDDFVAVAGLDGSLVPLRARKDFEVAFDGDATGGKIQVLQEIGYRGARGFAALTVDCDDKRGFHVQL